MSSTSKAFRDHSNVITRHVGRVCSRCEQHSVSCVHPRRQLVTTMHCATAMRNSRTSWRRNRWSRPRSWGCKRALEAFDLTAPKIRVCIESFEGYDQESWERSSESIGPQRAVLQLQDYCMPAEGHTMSDVTVKRLTCSLSLAQKLSLPLVLFATMAPTTSSSTMRTARR